MNRRNETLGFVGLGAMGQRLARRLLSHGFKVVVFDRTRTKAEALADRWGNYRASISVNWRQNRIS
jgi:3-hydroxyisobutyrate dehydrogenase-like beta-hydroxyacid dehydrogenase